MVLDDVQVASVGSFWRVVVRDGAGGAGHGAEIGGKEHGRGRSDAAAIDRMRERGLRGGLRLDVKAARVKRQAQRAGRAGGEKLWRGEHDRASLRLPRPRDSGARWLHAGFGCRTRARWGWGGVALLVIFEAITRLIPGVLGNPESLTEESHNSEGYLEYPNFTKPQEWRGISVPEILLSGNHAEIAKWRELQAIERAKKNL